ncbi:hypothetical protein [Tepidibacter sp. Z1-5]|uniref:hypothetical protein n=1 Tax=Tepidibacter sp. Z1-5 TaxID=3134138 RepID=UPI0030C2FA61
MGLFEKKKLYRVEIIKRCYPNIILNGYNTPMPSLDTISEKGNIFQIPPGIKGWVIEKFGKKYFRPDEDQEGIELFTIPHQPIALIDYKYIKGNYKII